MEMIAFDDSVIQRLLNKGVMAVIFGKELGSGEAIGGELGHGDIYFQEVIPVTADNIVRERGWELFQIEGENFRKKYTHGGFPYHINSLYL